jgi:hypothetical protein
VKPEGKGFRTPQTALLASQGRYSAKLDQACLAFVDCQAELCQALLQGSNHLLRVVHSLKAHYEVVRIAYDHDSTACLPSTPLLDPEIEDIVQKDVGQKRANACPLRRPPVSLTPLTAFQDAGVQPAPDQPEDTWVGNPMRQHPHQPLVVHRLPISATSQDQ